MFGVNGRVVVAVKGVSEVKGVPHLAVKPIVVNRMCCGVLAIAILANKLIGFVEIFSVLFPPPHIFWGCETQ